MDYSTFDDASLLRLIAHNHSEALGILYDRYGRLVFSIAYHMTGASEIAEEITQDVFLRCWEKAKTYDAELAKVSTWLINITRNRAIDELRRRKVRPEKNSSSWEDIPLSLEPYVDGPEEKAPDYFEHHQVRKAIASLPREQQQALLLAYFQGLSHSEIAEAVGEPLGTVKTRIRLGMQKLRQVLTVHVVNEHRSK
ncbi:MAG: sigma-70 family RNA polymerase sigma factor [Chloroflexi bacterium]|nr:MAG: sigma-70 family RNA polymerase sigma factor [Chloroflexota bacterium]